MINVTLFSKGSKDLGSGIAVEGYLNDIANLIRKADKVTIEEGDDVLEIKNKSHYIVRTSCKGSRKDANCSKTSTLLIIDMDKGTNRDKKPISPREVHIALKNANVNHFIYTTWSNSSSIPKFRILIETEEEYNKEQLKGLNSQFLLFLRGKAGILITHVKEMNTWSQPWFFGRYLNTYETYEYYEGNKFRNNPNHNPVAEESAASDEETPLSALEEMYENIRLGREFHESLRTISFQLVKDGMSKAHCKAQLKSLMNGSKEAGSDRWQKRYLEIDRLVDGVKDHEDSEETEKWSIGKAHKIVKMGLPKAPGLMGQFMTELEEFMNYRDETIAFVSSIFICSSIIGRKFNVDINDSEGRGKPTALNMYLTLAAETGSGKSEIEDSVENCYMQFSGANGNIQDFFFKGRVSGPRALYKRYLNQRCIGFIQNEKGIAGQSSLGDQQGMKDAWLNLYGQGAWNKWSGAAGFTDSDTDIKSIRGVAVSYVGESTPVELRKAYSKGDQVANGTIPREMIFTLGDLNTKPNRAIRKAYSKQIVERFNELISLCHREVSVDIYAPIILTSASSADRDRYLDIQEEYRARQNSGEDVLERAMSSRAFVKMLRLAGICTVINKGPEHERIGYIDKPEWEWAKKVVEYEYANMQQIVNLTNGSDDLGVAVKYAVHRITQMLDDTIKDSTIKLDRQHRDMRRIPCNYLKKAIRYTPAVLALDGDFKKAYKIVSGVDKVIGYMIDLGIISKAEKNPLVRGDCYRVLQGINEYI